MDQLDLMLRAPVASFIFVITLITSFMGFSDAVLRQRFIMNPYAVVRYKQYYRVLTSGLIHAGTWHLAFNMITFFFFAFYLEILMGHWQFAVLYILSLALSDVSTVIKHRDNPAYNSLGASGAVSAVVIALILFQPDIQLYIFFALPMPGWIFAILYIGYSIYAAKKADDNIGHEAHLWGALSGGVIALLISPAIRNGLMEWLGTILG
jgi:membrane associated rhomboid family serine protease